MEETKDKRVHRKRKRKRQGKKKRMHGRKNGEELERKELRSIWVENK